MKKAILMLFVLGFVSLNGYAQKVYKRGGMVYLECTVASGMPAGSVTITPKCKDGKASNTTFRNGSFSTDPYAAENDKVFEKLEIDNADYSSGETKNWVTAYDGCKSKGAGWRLPTQRELMLIYIFRVKLGELTGNNFVSTNYWSSLEYKSDSNWYVYFGIGNVSYSKKALDYRVRCVREVK